MEIEGIRTDAPGIKEARFFVTIFLDTTAAEEPSEDDLLVCPRACS